jgi:hypothetical protein
VTGTGDDLIVVKRRFAVILEDAFELPRPDLGPDDTLYEWAVEHIDDLYPLAGQGEGGVRMIWENQWRADVDSIDDVIHVIIH